MAQKKKSDISNLKFEEAVDALTEIVRGIEGGEIELEASLEQAWLWVRLMLGLLSRNDFLASFPHF